MLIRAAFHLVTRMTVTASIVWLLTIAAAATVVSYVTATSPLQITGQTWLLIGVATAPTAALAAILVAIRGFIRGIGAFIGSIFSTFARRRPIRRQSSDRNDPFPPLTYCERVR